MKYLRLENWLLPDIGIAALPPANILRYIPTTTITYAYDSTCCTLSKTTATTINHYNAANSSINTAKTNTTYNYDAICDRHQSESRSNNKATYADSHVYYYGYRYYCLELGRWVSRDPLGEEEKLVGLYVALENNPIASIDLLGKLSLPPGYPREPTMPEEGDIRGHCFDIDVGICCLIKKGIASGLCFVACLDCMAGSKLACLACVSCTEASRHAPDCITCDRWGCQKCSATGEWGNHEAIMDEPTTGGTRCYYSSGCAIYKVLDPDGYCEPLPGPLTDWDEVPCPSDSEE
jgi:RHS repeat-associated protein